MAYPAERDARAWEAFLSLVQFDPPPDYVHVAELAYRAADDFEAYRTQARSQDSEERTGRP